MNAILNFLVEANGCLIVIYALYHVLLRTENQFDYKRKYLVSGMVASLLFPLITLPVGGTNLIPSLSNSAAAYWLPEITVYADSTANALNKQSVISTWQWIMYVYLAGAGLLLLLFIYRILSLVNLFRVSKKYTWKNFVVAESEYGSGSFSFFRFIFIGRVNQLDESEKTEILNHEAIHAEKTHSFDILLVNLLKILFWFNPVVYLYRNSLVHVHEFEADARSVEGRDVDAYCSLLAKAALHANGYPLANHFTNSLTLKRIAMMKTVKQKIKHWKIAASVTALLLIFLVIACQDQVMQDIQSITLNSSAATLLPKEVEDKLNILKQANPKSEYIVMEMNQDGKEKLETIEIDAELKKTLIGVHVVKTSDQSFVILEKGERTNTLAEMTIADGEIFTVVDETASPVGGFTKFYEYIAMNLRYPLEARTKGIEGKVFVEFVVNKDGSLSDVRVIKGIGEGCDEESLRVVQNSPNWNPGKQRGIPIRQRMVIPITFKLGNSDKNFETGQITKPTMPEMVVVGKTKN